MSINTIQKLLTCYLSGFRYVFVIVGKHPCSAIFFTNAHISFY